MLWQILDIPLCNLCKTALPCNWVVCCRPPTAATRVWSQVRSFGILWWHQSGISPSTLVSHASSHSTNCSTFINHAIIQILSLQTYIPHSCLNWGALFTCTAQAHLYCLCSILFIFSEVSWSCNPNNRIAPVITVPYQRNIFCCFTTYVLKSV